tara:strand:- start:96 stop:284 length:189 start_codon:yes stop_codon:yes gene_type:complete
MKSVKDEVDETDLIVYKYISSGNIVDRSLWWKCVYVVVSRGQIDPIFSARGGIERYYDEIQN